MPESSTLEEYISVLEEYHSYLTEKQIEKRYIGHSGMALKPKSVQKLALCARAAANSSEKGKKINTLFGPARIVMSNGTVLFCR